MKTPKIAFVGDLTVDRYLQSGDVRLGGAAINCAIWTARAGGLPAIASAVGDDDAGQRFLRTLRAKGIGVTHIQTIPGQTSSIEINTLKNGERQYGQWDPGTLARYHIQKKNEAYLRRHNAVCVIPYPQYAHILDELHFLKARSRHPLVVINYGDLVEFDKNLRIVFNYVSLWDMAVFGLNKDLDESIINTLRELAQDENKTIIITLGQYGSLAYDGSKVFVQASGVAKIVDTTGAGDAFLSGFLVAYLRSRDVQQSLAAGTELASKAISHVGAY